MPTPQNPFNTALCEHSTAQIGLCSSVSRASIFTTQSSVQNIRATKTNFAPIKKINGCKHV